MLELALLFSKALSLKIAKKIYFHQVFNTYRSAHSGLVAETVVLKAALVVASTLEIPHFIVLSVSPSLVNFLKCGGIADE